MQSGEDVHKFGGLKRKGIPHKKRRPVWVDNGPALDVDDEYWPEGQDPMEEEIEKAEKWNKPRKGIIKCKGWSNKRSKGLPKHEKSGPINKSRGQNPFCKKSKTLGAPWK